MANSAQAKLTRAAAEATGMRFCIAKAHEVKTSDGSEIMRGKQRQFTCFNCQAQRKPGRAVR